MRISARPSLSLTFPAACAGMLLFGITLITLGSVASGLLLRYNLGALSAGALFSILPLGILAGSLVFGPLADRYGYKVIFVTSCLAMFIGFQGIAETPGLNVLKLCIFCFGFGGGAMNGATNALVADISARNKDANLSILGVFFAVGALGMPFVLGALGETDVQSVIATVGYLALLFALFFATVRFPQPKQVKGVSLFRVRQLLHDSLLLLVGLFLFCQSGFEGIINNWISVYLIREQNIVLAKSLYALSLYVAGMAVTRLILANVLRRISSQIVLLVSILFLFAGASLLSAAGSYAVSVTGLIFIGSGLAAGFPVMLGVVGGQYADVSGTAFSIVISIALVGNMLLNYTMGVISEHYGMGHLPTLAFVLSSFMLFLSLIIFKQHKSRINEAGKRMA